MTRRGKAFRGMQRARRMRGDLSCPETVPQNVWGGIASLPSDGRRTRFRLRQPAWHAPDFFDVEWLTFDDGLKDELAQELGLYDDQTWDLDPELVGELNADELADTEAVQAHLDNHIETELEFEFDRRVDRGAMSSKRRAQEMLHFQEHIRDVVEKRMTAHLLELLQEEAGLT